MTAHSRYSICKLVYSGKRENVIEESLIKVGEIYVDPPHVIMLFHEGWIRYLPQILDFPDEVIGYQFFYFFLLCCILIWVEVSPLSVQSELGINFGIVTPTFELIPTISSCF